LRIQTVSSDPAMAIGPSSDAHEHWPVTPIGSLCCRTNGGCTLQSATKRAGHPARKLSTADTEPFNQLLVTSFIGTPKIVKNLTTLRHELEQPAARVIVFDVTLEMVRETVDPLGEQRNLDFGRTGIAGFDGVRLDKLRLLCGRKRHRH
jgi:hypothetical protein